MAIEPSRQAFAAGWPEAHPINVLDDGLTSDREEHAALTSSLSDRFVRLVSYAASLDVAGVLVTCSAFGPAIEQAAATVPLPVVKPNEAMFDAALDCGPRVGMLATFAPAVLTMQQEFDQQRAGRHVEGHLDTVIAGGAMQQLRDGDGAAHDRIVAEHATRLGDVDAVMLAHFSTARAAAAVRAVTDRPVFAAPAAAVALLRHRVTGDRFTAYRTGIPAG